MSSRHEAGSDPSPEQTTPSVIVRDAWVELLSRKTQALYDEGAPSRSQRIGTRRSDLTLAGGNVSVASYDPQHSERFAELIKQQQLAPGELGNVIGAISFSKTLDSARFGGAIFLTDGEVAAGYAICSIDEGKALGQDSQQCFEFASELGLGGLWTEAMFDTQSNGDASDFSKKLFVLNEPSELTLGKSLQAIQST
jgi:hypothetical protein